MIRHNYFYILKGIFRLYRLIIVSFVWNIVLLPFCPYSGLLLVQLSGCSLLLEFTRTWLLSPSFLLRFGLFWILSLSLWVVILFSKIVKKLDHLPFSRPYILTYGGSWWICVNYNYFVRWFIVVFCVRKVTVYSPSDSIQDRTQYFVYTVYITFGIRD